MSFPSFLSRLREYRQSSRHSSWREYLRVEAVESRHPLGDVASVSSSLHGPLVTISGPVGCCICVRASFRGRLGSFLLSDLSSSFSSPIVTSAVCSSLFLSIASALDSMTNGNWSGTLCPRASTTLVDCCRKALLMAFLFSLALICLVHLFPCFRRVGLSSFELFLARPLRRNSSLFPGVIVAFVVHAIYPFHRILCIRVFVLRVLPLCLCPASGCDPYAWRSLLSTATNARWIRSFLIGSKNCSGG